MNQDELKDCLFVDVQIHPGLFASGAPWLTGASFKDSLIHYSNTALACTYVRDKGAGHITIDKEGKPRLHYKVDPFDQKSILKVSCCVPFMQSSYV